MKKLFFLFCVGMWLFSCKSQQVYPLKKDFTIIPANSYLKDLNNELDAFTGVYKTYFQGNEVTIYNEKQLNVYFEKGGYKYFKDVVVTKFIVKNANGAIIQDTKNMQFNSQQIKHTIYSFWVNPNNKLISYYGGTNCGVGWGIVELTKINATQLSWKYKPNDIILDDTTCPPGTDINIYLPETENLIFTKQ